MFRNRYFNVSFLFSVAWHLFWLSAIYIVITPTVKLQDDYADINFLGPILEKTAFEIMVDDSTPRTEILYPTSAMIDSETYLDIKGPKRLLKKDIFLGDGETKTTFREKSYLTEKVKPGYFMDGRSIFYHVEEKILNRLIEGPARSRAVLFKPQFPLVYKLSYGDEENLMTRLKFTLSREGNVELVEPVVSSGYPRIDSECIKYIKQWKFSPKAGALHEKEWGIITLNVNLE